jgi:hypothetical protein
VADKTKITFTNLAEKCKDYTEKDSKTTYLGGKIQKNNTVNTTNNIER